MAWAMPGSSRQIRAPVTHVEEQRHTPTLIVVEDATVWASTADRPDVGRDTKGQGQEARQQGPLHLVGVLDFLEPISPYFFPSVLAMAPAAVTLHKYATTADEDRKMFLRGDSVILGTCAISVRQRKDRVSDHCDR